MITERSPVNVQHEYDLEFLNFWEQYPRSNGSRPGKYKAFQVWQRLNPSSYMQQRILNALEIHKQSKQWKDADGAYIPHAQTWLRQKRWEDEIVTTNTFNIEGEHLTATHLGRWVKRRRYDMVGQIERLDFERERVGWRELWLGAPKMYLTWDKPKDLIWTERPE